MKTETNNKRFFMNDTFNYLPKALLYMALVLFLCFTVSLADTVDAYAQTLSYPNGYLELTVPDDTLVITSSTKKYDPIWQQAGITDSSEKLDEFKDMSIQALFCDPVTHNTVNYIMKQSTETVDIFNFALMSDSQLQSYVDALIEPTENITVTGSLVKGKETPFFRLEILVNDPVSPATEIIYGTIVNGKMIQFDLYQDGAGEADESFIKSIVDSAHFTKVMTREEYDEATKKGIITTVIIIAVLIAIIIASIMFSSMHQKKLKRYTLSISEAMQDFRIRRSNNPSAFVKAPCATCDTVYDDKLIDEFITYTTWVKPAFKIAIAAVIILTATIVMFRSNMLAFAIVTAAVGVIALYTSYSNSEKRKVALKKQYDTKLKKTARIRFFDEYFTVSGLGSIAEYVNKQVTDVRNNKGVLYIYLGNDLAIILDCTKLDGMSATALKTKLMSERIR